MKQGNNKDKMVRITSNIDSLQKILNYARVRNMIPNPSTNASYSYRKWANSMYRIHLGNIKAMDIDPSAGNYPYFNEIGHGDSIISPTIYNRIHSIVLARQSEFFVQVDEGQVDAVTDLVIAILEGSLTLYAMTVALWRTQTGYLFKDEDKIYLGPVFFNHDYKGASQADWAITSNNSFEEEIIQTSLNTQAKIQASNEVWGTFSVANEPWANMISQVLSNIYLPDNLKWVCEHLFGTVFIDPQFSYTFRSVTFFPDSTIKTYSYDSANDDWNRQTNNLADYDAFDGTYGANNLDNTSSWNDYLTYVNTWSEFISDVFNHYPYLDTIMNDLKWNGQSNFDFTRNLKHNEVYFVLKENIADLIESVARPDANPESSFLTDSMAEIGQLVPFSVRDELELKYGETLEYYDQADIELDYSIEYLLKGKVFPCRFAMFGYDDNNIVGYYRYSYLVPRILSDFSIPAYNLSIMYINCDLNDFGSVQPLHNLEMTSVPVSGVGSDGVLIVPSVRCYYTPLENLGNYCNRAYDTFILPEFQKGSKK